VEANPGYIGLQEALETVLQRAALEEIARPVTLSEQVLWVHMVPEFVPDMPATYVVAICDMTGDLIEVLDMWQEN